VFHSWGGEPKAEIHARRVARTTGNLELAVRYLRAKLYSISLVERVAEATGGDVRSTTSWAASSRRSSSARPRGR